MSIHVAQMELVGFQNFGDRMTSLLFLCCLLILSRFPRLWQCLRPMNLPFWQARNWILMNWELKNKNWEEILRWRGRFIFGAKIHRSFRSHHTNCSHFRIHSPWAYHGEIGTRAKLTTAREPIRLQRIRSTEQLSTSFRACVWRQYCTVYRRFCKQVSESTHRRWEGFLVLCCTAPKMELEHNHCCSFTTKNCPSIPCWLRYCSQYFTVYLCFNFIEYFIFSSDFSWNISRRSILIQDWPTSWRMLASMMGRLWKKTLVANWQQEPSVLSHVTYKDPWFFWTIIFLKITSWCGLRLRRCVTDLFTAVSTSRSALIFLQRH